MTDPSSAFIVPNNWEATTLGFICTLINGDRGKNYPGRKSLAEHGVPFVNAGDLQSGKLSNERLGFIPHSTYELLRSGKFVRGDILYCIRGSLGKVALNTQLPEGAIASSLIIVRPKTGILPAYIYYYLASPLAHQMVQRYDNGTAQPNLSGADLARFQIPLPNFPTQRKIVAKIEVLLSELDKGVESLTTAREQLKAYRQSVLLTAFEGKLTEGWRSKCRPANASMLASSIASEHQQRSASCSCEKTSRPRRRRKEIDETELFPDHAEIAELPEIPEKWLYVRLAALGVLARGKSRHRPRNAPELFGGPYPFIQTGEVKAARGTITQFCQTYSEFGLSQSRLWPVGTLCITIAANIAETAFLGFEACFPDSVVGFTPDCALVDSRYVEFFIQATRARISAYAPATAQKNINLETLENLVIPYCSLKEQAEIVHSLDEKLEIVDLMETEIDAGLARANALRQSILKRAFSGQLVAQDPADEPASVLLKRIRAERDENGTTKRRNNKSNKEAA